MERESAASAAEAAEAAETALYDPEVLAGLACEIGARPKGAPHFGDLAGAVRAVHREAGALVVDYDPAVREELQAVIEAERRCCPEIGWHLEELAPPTTSAAGATAGPARLRIEASPVQLDVLQHLFEPPRG